MRRVILESPYAGDVEANIAYARRCIADCLRRGEAPIVVYTDCGVSLGMAAAVQEAMKIELPIERRSLAERSS